MGDIFSEVLTLRWIMNECVGGAQESGGGEMTTVPSKRTATKKLGVKIESSLRDVDHFIRI